VGTARQWISGDEQDSRGRVLESNDGAAAMVSGTVLRIDGGGTAQYRFAFEDDLLGCPFYATFNESSHDS
jgi:hypothetical protein